MSQSMLGNEPTPRSHQSAEAEPIAMPELAHLQAVLGPALARRLAPAPGGWRTLSECELVSLGVEVQDRRRVQHLQRLALSKRHVTLLGVMASPETVARVYMERIGDLDTEVVIALALDGQNNVIQELEVARGGVHGAALVPADVFRPLIRAGARAAVLIHNHPSGDPTPSRDDLHMTQAVAAVGEIVGVPILDHVIVARESWSSLAQLGVLEPTQENQDE